MATNMPRQPSQSMSTVSSGAAIAGPSADAEDQPPAASPRSRTWNQSVVARFALGMHGDSPTPRKTRATMNCPYDVTNPAATCARDQIASPTAIQRRGPNRSANAPEGTSSSA